MNPAMGLRVDLHTLTIPNATLLHDLQLSVPPGVVHTVMGASGTGKSSLLLAVCGALPEGLAFQGTVTLNGQRLEHLPPQARRVGILFQDDLLFAHMTVRENLLFAVPAGPQAEREAQVTQGLADVEMQPFANANPAAKQYMDADLVNNPEVYPPQEVLDKLYVSNTPTPQIMRLMTRSWSKVKSNK